MKITCRHYVSLLSFVLLVVSSVQLVAKGGKYPIHNFTPADYKAGIQNIDFAQNRDMTLFVANNLGVLSYNGNEWRLHAFQSGKKKRSMALDDITNRLYVGSQGEFGYLQKDWSYVSLTDIVPASVKDFDEVWDVFIYDNQVYFCTFQGIYVYNGNSIEVIEDPNNLDRSFHGNGKLFTQNQTGKLFEIDGSELKSTYPQNVKDQIIRGMIAFDQGYLLFYNSGLIEHTTTFGVTPKFQDLSQALRGTYVNHVLQLSDTRLSISTQTSGLFIYDVETNTIERITAQDGLESNSCLRTFQDYTGNLWVGMQSGIAIVYINSPMRYINQEIGLNGSGYEAFESENGTYYSTSNGIYFLPQNREQCIFLRGTEGPAYGIQEIGGNIYACHHTGLFQLLSDQARRIATTDGLWDVKQLNSNPEYAIGGTYSGLYLFRIDDNQYLQPIQQIEGFNETSRFFEEDNHGSIWVSQYYRGLYRLILSEDFKSVIPEKITTDDGTPIDQQIILSSIDNELYIATSEGVFQYDQTKNTIVEDDIFSKLIGRQSVYLFEQDKQKNVHLITENQVGFFKKISSRNYVFVPSSLYQLRYYLNNDLLNISSNTERGVLFSSNEGFIHYNPNLENQLSSERPIAISRISSVTQDSILYLLNPFEKKPDHDLNLVIGPYDKTIQIDVESYQYNNVTNPKFRYFLKGLDDDYGEWTSASMKEYTNLKEGKYEFNAQARNHLGEIFSTQILHIQVDPPIHLSTAFKLLYILLGCLLLLLLFRGQKRKYSKETLKIEEAKEHQLAEEQQKLVELQQQKEKEMLALTEEKMKSELRHVNNLLAASTMNLVVKNEFIENIKEELKEVNKKDKNVQTSQALKKIVKEIDTSLRLQEDWEQFEYHFDQVHGDFLSRLRDQFHDLSPNEQKLSALLRLNLNTKEISNLMSISVRGVEVARYRLRQKLELEKGQNLSKFILEY